MPPSKGPFSTNLHSIIPQHSVPIPQGMCVRQMVRAPPKMHWLGPLIHLESPLAPQPVPLKLDSMPPSKCPFSTNIHPIIPKLSVPIPEGMCFRKMVGAPFANARVGAKNPLQITIRTPACFLQTRLKFTFQRSFLHEYAFHHSQLCCAYSSGHMISKKVSVFDWKCTGIGKNNVWNHSEHPSRYRWNLIQCHFLRNNSPRIYIRSFPNFLCLYPRVCAFGKMVEGPLQKCTGWGPKSIWNHP